MFISRAATKALLLVLRDWKLAGAAGAGARAATLE